VNSVFWSLAVLASALILDRLFGDPLWMWSRLPHPIAMMGRAIGVSETKFNNTLLGFAARRWRGIFTLSLLVIATTAVGAVVTLGLHRLPLGLVVEALLLAILLAHKSLVDHVTAVARALDAGGPTAARGALSHIVGRDVNLLDQSGVARAAVESAAENFSDGVVAPAFWYLLLGLPGLFVYKLVNTADSMIGYRSPRYEAFGWAAARLDDVLNWIPARLSALLIAAAATAPGSAGKALAIARRDAARHKSPNAGWPEAAMAGALGLALGGPRQYGDAIVDGAWLNPAGRASAGAEEIRAAVKLVDMAGALLFILVALATLITFAIGR
jgi:adenosylcobinamide-phosphate synthase